MRVAVYGSLLSGFGNNALLGDSIHIGDGRTQPEFKMFSFGAFPVIAPGKESIEVEVYEVDDQVMRSLDSLEGYPNFYDRKVIDVDSHLGEAWIYFQDQEFEDRLPHVESGSWREHYNG